MPVKRFSAALLGAALLLGCASSGENFNESNVSQIQKGVTTEADLVRMFGNPTQRSSDSEGNTQLHWVYAEARTNGKTFIPYAGAFMGGTDTANKSLFVTLGPDGTVSRYQSNTGAISSRGHTQDAPH